MTTDRFLSLADLPVDGRVVVYGSGAAGQTVADKVREDRPDVTIPCFMDSFDEGEAGGLPVVKLANLDSLKGTYDLILVASAWWRDIGNDLTTRGVTNWGVAAPSLWHKYIYSKGAMRAAGPELGRVHDMLASTRDRVLYDFLVDARREGSQLVSTDKISPEIRNFPQVKRTFMGHLTRQYMDFVNREAISTVLHAGAFDGTDCVKFLDGFPNLKAVHGFEPQGTARFAPETLDRLDASGKVHIHTLGLWDSSTSVPFTGQGQYTTLTPDAAPNKVEGSITTVSVDEFVQAQGIDKVDYLCLDVEGAEDRVINGAAQTIRDSRPQLAVCIYHLKEDIFRLPLKLDALLDGYVYRLGHYHNFLNETVLYALPEELA